jgi:hypothetical protein
MAKIDDLRSSALENLNWRSENATTAARNLSLGVLVLVWGILALGEGNDLLSSRLQHWLLISSGAAAIIGLSADWLQALIGHINASRAYDRVYSDSFKPEDKIYPIDWTYKVTKGAFAVKQIAAPIAAALLLACLLLSNHLWSADEKRNTDTTTAQSTSLELR